jgi:TP901 family phage tail tape measure protein
MAIFIPLVTRFDDKGLSAAQRALQGFQNFAVQAAKIAAAAIAGVAIASVREAVQFETTFAKIQGLVGLTQTEIDELQLAARRLGPAFGASATEAGEALFFITSAGLRGAGAVEVLEASLKGAAIGLGDAKTIADLATSAVNAYGEANLGGAQAVDILAEAVRLGKLEPAELGSAIGQVIPLASVLGVEFHELGAAFAGMSKTGTDAATASTQLKGIFNALIKPTVGSHEALKSMGLSAEGLREQVKEKGLLSVLQTLMEAFDGNVEATAEVFGNVRALTGVFNLMGAQAENNVEIFRLMADGIGVVDEAFGIVEETVQFKFDKAMATARDGLLGIGLAIVERLQPHLDTFLTWLETNGPGIADTFANMFEELFNFIESDAVQSLVKQFQDLAPEIGETAKRLGELILKLVPLLFDALDKVLPMLKDMASILDDVGFFLDEVIGRFGEWEGGTNSIVSFLERQLNPMARLADLLDRVARALNDVRTAYERLKSSGINPLEGVVAPSFGGRRASGGPVSSGRSFLVGEMGPEIFTPAAGGGTITPNNRIGGANINITVNAGMGSNGAQIGAEIVKAIKRYERTSGPVFASA